MNNVLGKYITALEVLEDKQEQEEKVQLIWDVQNKLHNNNGHP